MKFSEMMKIINKMIKSGVNEINKKDVDVIFGRTDDSLAEELEYLGCDVQRVSDLFNVKFAGKFTKEEIQKQIRLEKMIEL